MTKEEFETKYPLILAWIQQTIANHAPQARTIASLGFKRLPQYFSPDALEAAKVVYVEAVPTPPLSAIGLNRFAEFENMNAGGITYLNTVFARREMRKDERLHFHELVHIIQWQSLGPKSFLTAYADGLERIGYRQSPLEAMAYTLEGVFRNSQNPFDVATVVREQLVALYGAR
jgi:hypothetical protein